MGAKPGGVFICGGRAFASVKLMPKNIVICCDGTGNEFGNSNSNVVKLFSVLALNPKTQVAYYDPGIGTMGAHNALTRAAKWCTKMLGLAFGAGLMDNIGDAYRFLMQNWEPWDRLYLFGFSRGAYTVRALASLLYLFGLLPRDNEQLTPYILRSLERMDTQGEHLARRFKEVFSMECRPHFVGVWDTVSSVGWMMDPLKIRYTANNPDIHTGRHAIAIDERRCFFRQNLWGQAAPGQNYKQVWFAGVHGDVGGGYREEQSGLAKVALEWMIAEAVARGIIGQRRGGGRSLGTPAGQPICARRRLRHDARLHVRGVECPGVLAAAALERQPDAAALRMGAVPQASAIYRGGIRAAPGRRRPDERLRARLSSAQPAADL